MKFLGRLVRRFYSSEWKTSEQQLVEDFGEFPPAPLRCEGLEGNFNVIRTHGLGELYQEYVTLKAFFAMGDTNPQSISTDFFNYFGGVESFANLQRSLAVLGGESSLRKRVIISVVLGIILIKKIPKVLWHGSTRPTAYGAFVPVFKNESQILIKAGRHRNNKKSDESTISHEHIHLLQYRNPEAHSRHVISPQQLLTDEGLSKSFLLYTLEKQEVEARLHECVLSFYRAHKNLPLTKAGFLGLLASSNEFGKDYSLRLELIGDVFVEYGNYTERDAIYSEQLAFILMDIKTHELAYRFITEVLTVMYGNLLKYYGDSTASRTYLQTIARPNLYDDLYTTLP